MNEITAAIKKKAEEKWPYYTSPELLKFNSFEIDDERKRFEEVYSDAIGFMLKFVEWVQVSGYEYLFADEIWMNIKEEAWNKYTTEQLLIKFLEDNKL